MMTPEELFELFKKPEENDEIILDYRKHPLYIISYFRKLVEPYIKDLDLLIYQAKLINPNLQDQFIIDKLNNVYIEKGFEIIKNLDLEKHKEYIINESNEQFLNGVKYCLEYFLQNEDYEKCAFLRDLHKIILDNLVKKYF